MTSLVIGGTGIVIVDRLLQAGEMPIALSRSTRSSSATDVEWLKGDLAEPSIFKLPPGYDALLHGPRRVARECAAKFVIVAAKVAVQFLWQPVL